MDTFMVYVERRNWRGRILDVQRYEGIWKISTQGYVYFGKLGPRGINLYSGDKNRKIGCQSPTSFEHLVG